MSHIRIVAALALALASVAVPASAQMQKQMDEVDNPADKAFIGAMRDMMMGMHRAMPTGDTDVDFVRMMLPHHQAAVDMAKAEMQYGKDDMLKAMAKDIVTAQEKEIAMMKAWEDKQKGAH